MPRRLTASGVVRARLCINRGEGVCINGGEGVCSDRGTGVCIDGGVGVCIDGRMGVCIGRRGAYTCAGCEQEHEVKKRRRRGNLDGEGYFVSRHVATPPAPALSPSGRSKPAKHEGRLWVAARRRLRLRFTKPSTTTDDARRTRTIRAPTPIATTRRRSRYIAPIVSTTTTSF